MTNLLIIGGSDAGISAALRAKEINPAVDITVLVADRFPNYSICGLPFYLSGEVPDWHPLAHRIVDEIEKRVSGFYWSTRPRALILKRSIRHHARPIRPCPENR